MYENHHAYDQHNNKSNESIDTEGVFTKKTTTEAGGYARRAYTD